MHYIRAYTRLLLSLLLSLPLVQTRCSLSGEAKQTRLRESVVATFELVIALGSALR
jgi:hypothetical protein